MTPSWPYRGVIPVGRWDEPYLPLEELKREISRGFKFWGYEETRQPAGEEEKIDYWPHIGKFPSSRLKPP